MVYRAKNNYERDKSENSHRENFNRKLLEGLMTRLKKRACKKIVYLKIWKLIGASSAVRLLTSMYALRAVLIEYRRISVIESCNLTIQILKKLIKYEQFYSFDANLILLVLKIKGSCNIYSYQLCSNRLKDSSQILHILTVFFNVNLSAHCFCHCRWNNKLIINYFT